MANNIAAVPVIAREIGKKKKGNRSAKLKQCKLDARREQWLSQVKNNGYKDTTAGTSPISPPQGISECMYTKMEHLCQIAAVALKQDGSNIHASSDAESPTHHPSEVPLRKDFPGCSISCSGSSIGSSSRSVSDAEEEEDETGEKGGGGLDDWEAVADALSVFPDNGQDYHSKPANAVTATATVTMRSPERTKRKPELTIPRAWRADDVFRPRTLPNLLKQHSFPMNIERHQHYNHCGVLSRLPSSCPICCEDLDLTDSSFLPCSCGFHLCLFCHKKILEADGRCPGCRKHYSAMPGSDEIDIISGVRVSQLPYRLSHSCSMSSRS